MFGTEDADDGIANDLLPGCSTGGRWVAVMDGCRRLKRVRRARDRNVCLGLTG